MTENPGTQHPSRADVWSVRSAPDAFPTRLVQRAITAASFFSAAFHGRNDVIYLDEARVPDIVLVDLNQENLAAMARIYPTVTATYCDDAFAIARKLADDGRRFDVVVSDPFTGMTRTVLFDHFADFAALAKDVWITGITRGELEQSGVTPDVKGVQAWLNASPERKQFKVDSLSVRNAESGVCWLALRRKRGLFGFAR